MAPRHYDRHAWAAEQAALLRLLQPDGIDWEGIADEFDDLGKCVYREIERSFTTLITHKLLQERDPTRRDSAAIRELRKRTIRRLSANSSLLRKLNDFVIERYNFARDRASGEANVAVEALPDARTLWNHH